jgi:hypothetical protein
MLVLIYINCMQKQYSSKDLVLLKENASMFGPCGSKWTQISVARTRKDFSYYHFVSAVEKIGFSLLGGYPNFCFAIAGGTTQVYH